MTKAQRPNNFSMILFACASGAVLALGCSSNEPGSGSAGVPTAGSSGTPGSSGNAGSGALGGAGHAGSASGSGGGAGASAAGTGGAAGASASAAGMSGAGGVSGAGGGPPSSEKFSFFVTSMKGLFALAKARDNNADVGFGGDLTYGEVGAGAGLRGADKICAALAEQSMPGNNKTWRAFLSVTADENGQQVNAIDRIGNGPWYDRLERTVAMSLDGLESTRPSGGNAEIADNLPNEDGVPNDQPDPNEDPVDNHDTLTGSNAQGQLDADSMADTCNDWTSKVGQTGKPRIGHSWPRNGQTQSWISAHEAGGCAPSMNLFASGGPQPGDYGVGAGGGYGGFYCFALQP